MTFPDSSSVQEKFSVSEIRSEKQIKKHQTKKHVHNIFQGIIPGVVGRVCLRAFSPRGWPRNT